MCKRILFAAVIAFILLPSVGCCWRRGCSKCNTCTEAPAPSNYCPPSCP